MNDTPPPSWIPSLREGGPVYRELVRALESDIRSGALQAGDRLPTHRELATHLGISRGTVAKAYDEANRLGLAHSGVGQGTFVSHSFEVRARHEHEEGEIDLGMGYPLYEFDPDPAPVLASLASDPDRQRFLRYPAPGGEERHRRAGARWCAERGVETSPEDVLVTNGGQHAIHLWLLAAFRPGEVLLTAELTYPMAMTAARSLGVEVRGVAMDEEGLLPEDLARLAEEPGVRGLFVMPNVQNPTTGTLSLERRQDLVSVIQRTGLRVFEDDIHGPYLHRPSTALKALCPEHVTYAASLSKTVAGGLRTAFLVPPANESPALVSALIASTWSPPPLTVEIACRWIEDGTAQQVIERKRKEALERQELLRGCLEGTMERIRGGAYFAWLDLPAPWTANRFAFSVRQRGVTVMPAESFYCGRSSPPEAVRIAMGEVSRPRLEQGLGILAETLARSPEGPTRPIL